MKKNYLVFFLISMFAYSQEIPAEYHFDTFVISNDKNFDIHTEKKIITFSSTKDENYSLYIDNYKKTALLNVKINNVKYQIEFEIEKTVYNENDLKYLVPKKYYEINSLETIKKEETTIKIKNSKKQKEIHIIKNSTMSSELVYYFEKTNSDDFIDDTNLKKSMSEKYNITFDSNEHLIKTELYIENNKIFEGKKEKEKKINILFRFELNKTMYSKDKNIYTSN